MYSLLFLMSICFLYLKHDVGNDSTISEWLINYSGGFTKRGIIGQISIYIARIFDSELRDIILYLQVLIIGTYFTFIFIFLKKTYIEKKTIKIKKLKIKRPLEGSLAKVCTELSIPDLTKNVPVTLIVKVKILSTITQE